MIKAVLFDFGGVLSETGKKGFIRQILSELYGVPEAQMDTSQLQYEWRRSQTDEESIFAALNQKYNKQITKEMFYDRAKQDTLKTAEVYELAERLRKAGIKTGILSNIFTTSAQQLREGGFYKDFEPVVLSCDEGYAKPDKELYDIAVERTGVNPSEILFIDDQEKCQPPAEAIGMRFILATSPEQIIRETTALIEAENGIKL